MDRVIFGRPSRIPLFLFSVCLFGFGQDRFASFENTVFRVSPTNQISVVSLLLERQWIAELRGSTLPSAAPDGSFVAFIRGHDLWLYDAKSERSARVTHTGRPYTQTLASVETLISAWSADSKRLLLAVVPGDTECVDCETRGDWRARQYNYGYYIYDVRARTLRKANLGKDFEVAALLEDGRVFGFDNGCRDQPIQIVSPTGKVTAVPGSLNLCQLDVSKDGSSAVAAVFQGRSSFIVKLDLITGESTRLSSVGAESEFQFPKLSLDMQHTAWLREQTELMMDGRSIFSCSDPSLQFQWLGEQRIAGKCAHEMFVLEARTGRKLAKVVTPK
jgi:hypothetical protein